MTSPLRPVRKQKAISILISAIFFSALLFLPFTTTAPDTLRVAVCIAGNARTLHHKLTQTLLQAGVLQPLRQRYHVDVFTILRTDDTPTADRPKAHIDKAAIETAIRQMAPANATFIKDPKELRYMSRYRTRDVYGREHFIPPPHCNIPNNRWIRFPHTLLRARQCLDAIETRERMTGQMYDWTYRLRPDVVYLNGIPLPDDLQSDTAYLNQGRIDVTQALENWWLFHRGKLPEYSGPVSDILSITPRRWTRTFLRAFDVVDDCALFVARTQGGPENVLRFWLMTQDVKYREIPFDWVIIREDLGPECDRLVHQRGPSSNATRSVEQCIGFAKTHKSLFPHMRYNITMDNGIQFKEFLE